MIQGFLCKEEAQGFWNGEKNVREIIIFVRGKSMYRLIMATKESQTEGPLFQNKNYLCGEITFLWRNVDGFDKLATTNKNAKNLPFR